MLTDLDLENAARRIAADFSGGEFERLAADPFTPDINVVNTIGARRRYVAAMRAMSPKLSPVIVAVCCLKQTFADFAIDRSISEADAEALYRKGLQQLARHYAFETA